MKKIFTFTILFLSVLTLSAQSLMMKVKLSDGTTQEFSAALVDSIYFEEEPYVDLQLESGVKWATMNVGAESDSKPGTPYKWNEAEDAIKTVWGHTGEWRMPTKDDFQELIDQCKWSLYTENGKEIGYKVANKENENIYIILPFATSGDTYYWTSTLYSATMANALVISEETPNFDQPFKFSKALYVRPVLGKAKPKANLTTGTPKNVGMTEATIPVTITSAEQVVVESYGVYYSTNPDMSDSQEAPGAGTLTLDTPKDVKLTGLTSQTSYYYQAYAHLKDIGLVTSAISTTPLKTTAKELSVEATVTPYTNSAKMKLKISGNAVGEDVSYKVYLSEHADMSEASVVDKGTSIKLESTSGFELPIDLDNLISGRTYYYQVEASYDSGGATANAEGNFETGTKSLSIKVSVKETTANSATLNLEITGNDLEDQVTYKVSYSTDATMAQGVITKTGTVTLSTTSGETHEIYLGSLKSNSTYYYQVTAQYSDKSSNLEEGDFTTLSKTLTITNVYVTPKGTTSADVVMRLRGNSMETVFYEFHYGLEENPEIAEPKQGNVKLTTESGQDVSFNLTGLQPGKNYYYRALARYSDSEYIVKTGTFETQAKSLKVETSVQNITSKSATFVMEFTGNSYEEVNYTLVYATNAGLTENAVTKTGTITLTSTASQQKTESLVNLKDDTEYFYQLSYHYSSESETFVVKDKSFKTKEKFNPVKPDLVDLGLSVKWSTFNLGAKNANEAGDFFGWGDPTGESISQTDRYGNNTVSPPADLSQENKELDIVYVSFGDEWHTPTSAQLLELVEKCTWVQKVDYMGTGMNGWLVTGKGDYSDKSIFIPASGCRQGLNNEGKVMMSADTNAAYYWSSELSNDANTYGYGIFVKLSGTIQEAYAARTFYGMHIRPVYGDGDTPQPPKPQDENWADSIATTLPDGSIVPVDGVDLGLPSGTKWANWNLGSTERTGENAIGGYYAWGETSTKTDYSYANYTLEIADLYLPEDQDAAFQNWGKEWRMPTEDDWYELKQNTTRQWETVDGVEGYRFTSKVAGYTDRSVFLPAAGVMQATTRSSFGTTGYYWSNTNMPKAGVQPRATCYKFNNEGGINDPSANYDRFCGLSVRPVKPAKSGDE